VICGLSRGDLPVTFHWLKDDVPLSINHNFHHHHHHLQQQQQQEQQEPNQNVEEPVISSVDLFSSLLTLNRLKSEHTGNYTCLAVNPAGSSRFTAALRVKGEPSCQ